MVLTMTYGGHRNLSNNSLVAIVDDTFYGLSSLTTL